MFFSFQDVQDAKYFAIQAHGDQKYGDESYQRHLIDVANLSLEMFSSLYTNSEEIINEIQIISWLHDVVEDTDSYSSVNKIKIRFGKDILNSVLLLTDDISIKVKKERKIKKYMELARTNNIKVIGVKICDRLANVRASEKNLIMLQKYIDDHDIFRVGVYRTDIDMFRKYQDEIDKRLSVLTHY